MNIRLILAISLFLTSCTGSSKNTYTIPEGLSAISAKTPINCRFEKSSSQGNSQQSTNWYFWRDTQRAESRDEWSNQGEIWEHNSAGQLSYTRLFYKERVALEFMPGDLAATGATPTWRQLTSLVDPKTLDKELALLSKENSGQIAVEYYRGTVNNVPTEVDWLPTLQLPARVLKKLPEGTVTLNLASCEDNSKLPLASISKAEFDDFRHLNYTDLGDMEDDPMVQHIQQLMSGHSHKSH